jgi:hypothetical protein
MLQSDKAFGEFLSFTVAGLKLFLLVGGFLRSLEYQDVSYVSTNAPRNDKRISYYNIPLSSAQTVRIQNYKRIECSNSNHTTRILLVTLDSVKQNLFSV